MGTRIFKKGQHSAEDTSLKMETNASMFITRNEFAPDDFWMEKNIKKQTNPPTKQTQEK